LDRGIRRCNGEIAPRLGVHAVDAKQLDLAGTDEPCNGSDDSRAFMIKTTGLYAAFHKKQVSVHP